jgi:hypothetical protein
MMLLVVIAEMCFLGTAEVESTSFQIFASVSFLSEAAPGKTLPVVVA